jgi:hypothetical protein
MKTPTSIHHARPVHFLAILAGMVFIFGLVVPGAVFLVNWVAHLVLGT